MNSPHGQAPLPAEKIAKLLVDTYTGWYDDYSPQWKATANIHMESVVSGAGIVGQLHEALVTK